MCWYHRRPTTNSAYNLSLKLSRVQHRLHFAWCVRTTGFIYPKNSNVVCKTCYSRFPSEYHRNLYNHFHSHYLTYAARYKLLKCRICKSPLVKVQSIQECTLCYEVHTAILIALNKQERSIANCEGPLFVPINESY